MKNKKTSKYKEIFPYAVSPFHLLCSDPIFSQWPVTTSFFLSLLFFIFSGFAEISLFFILIFLTLSPLMK